MTSPSPGLGLSWTAHRQFGAVFELGRIAAGDPGAMAVIRRRKRRGRDEWEAFVFGTLVPGTHGTSEQARAAAERALCGDLAQAGDGQPVRCLRQPGHKESHRGRTAITRAGGPDIAILTWRSGQPPEREALRNKSRTPELGTP